MDFGFNLGFEPHHPHQNEEHRIQCACVTWFRCQYPKFRSLLFSVPNGGFRLQKTARELKDEGQLAGVSDLILLVPNRHYHALCIEMKSAKGVQRATQKLFQKAVESQGYKYIVSRSLDDFMAQIREYLTDT